MKTAQDFEIGSRRRVIADFFQADSLRTRRDAYRHFVQFVRNQTPLFVFKRNPTATEKLHGITHRVPKPMGDQLVELANEIGRVYALMHGYSAPSKSPKINQALIDAANEGEAIDI